MSPKVDRRLSERSAAILDAALALFLEQGYERTTMADVVDRAGGSLATVYKLFGNKCGLFAAVVDDFRDVGSREIIEITDKDLPPRETLLRIAFGLQRIALSPEHIAFVRMLIGHSVANPKFAREIFESSDDGKREALREMFARWHRRGLVTSSPDMLADVFFGMAMLEFHTQAISHGTAAQATPDMVEERLEFFMRGAGFPPEEVANTKPA